MKKSKEILDVLNWLKSELSEAEHPKLTKTINHDRVRTLKYLIYKLSE